MLGDACVNGWIDYQWGTCLGTCPFHREMATSWTVLLITWHIVLLLHQWLMNLFFHLEAKICVQSHGEVTVIILNFVYILVFIGECVV